MWIKKKEYELLYARLDRLQQEKKEAFIYAAELKKAVKNFLKNERKTQNYRSVHNVLNKLETEIEKIGGNK